MTPKPLFGDLISAYPGLEAELKTVDVAADLTLLLHHSGMSREDLANKLGWSPDRLSQVLSGQEAISVPTISAVAGALGYTFDLIFRKKGTSPESRTSDEVRAGLAEHQLTDDDVTAAIDWARTQTLGS